MELPKAKARPIANVSKYLFHRYLEGFQNEIGVVTVEEGKVYYFSLC